MGLDPSFHVGFMLYVVCMFCTSLCSKKLQMSSFLSPIIELMALLVND